MANVSLDAAKEAKEEAREASLRDNQAGIPDDHRVDWEESTVADVKIHAESMVLFDHIANISINTYGNDENLLDMEQNLRGAGQYGFDLDITIADPEVVDGQVWVDDPDAEFPQYKVISDPEDEDNDYELRESIIKDDDGQPVDTEIEGIGALGPSQWDGQPVEEFDPDYATISISSRRAARILGVLDTAGMWYTDQDGNVVEGLFEAPPNMGTDDYDSDEDGYPRLVGYPELRADMVGQSGAITATFGPELDNGNRPTEVDVFKVVEDETDALTPLTPQDDAYALPEYPRGNALYWSDSDGAGADAEPQTSDGVAEAQDALNDETFYDDLNDDEQDFVDDAANIVEDMGLDSITELDGEDTDSEYDDFGERVAAQKGTEDIRHSTDTLVEIIDSLA